VPECTLPTPKSVVWPWSPVVSRGLPCLRRSVFIQVPNPYFGLRLSWSPVARLERTGRQSDKKPPNFAQTLSFLSPNQQKRSRNQQKIRSQNSKKYPKRGGSGGRQPPPTVAWEPPRAPTAREAAPFQAADSDSSLPGIEGLGFQAKKSQIQPQDFLSINFLSHWPDLAMVSHGLLWSPVARPERTPPSPKSVVWPWSFMVFCG